jgi:hypothetical protein
MPPKPTCTYPNLAASMCTVITTDNRKHTGQQSESLGTKESVLNSSQASTLDEHLTSRPTERG